MDHDTSIVLRDMDLAFIQFSRLIIGLDDSHAPQIWILIGPACQHGQSLWNAGD